jgi:hypothetical protein
MHSIVMFYDVLGGNLGELESVRTFCAKRAISEIPASESQIDWQLMNKTLNYT